MMKSGTQTERKRCPKPDGFASSGALKVMKPVEMVTATEGAQLLEFSMVLPLLLVFLVGIIQFGGAFLLKQKMANAVLEGARIVVSNGLSDTSCGSVPCSIQAATQAVANYMTNAGVNSSCINPSSLSSTGTFTWTVSCPTGISIKINRSFPYTTGGGQPMIGTQVTLTFPYRWFFNNVISLLVPSSSLSLPTTLTETAVMQNLVGNN